MNSNIDIAMISEKVIATTCPWFSLNLVIKSYAVNSLYIVKLIHEKKHRKLLFCISFLY